MGDTDRLSGSEWQQLKQAAKAARNHHTVPMATEPSTPHDRLKKLERLAHLRETGHLDEDEYIDMKAELFTRVESATPTANAHQRPSARGPGRTSGFAIAALVLSILWIGGVGSVLGLIFGILALGEIDRSQGSVRGSAIASWSIALGVLGLLASIVFLVTWAGQ